MRIPKLFAATAFAALIATVAQAQDTEQIKAALNKKFPEAAVDTVRKVPYGNLYEVTSGGRSSIRTTRRLTSSWDPSSIPRPRKT
jgi:hypothetical protein